MASVVVVGAGVMGLSCGIRLSESGVDAHIVARERTPNTTSDAAAAIFFPFGVKPWERVAPWANTTRIVFQELSRKPETGVGILDILEVYDRHHDKPWWGEVVPEYRRADPRELPADYVDGFAAKVPLIEMPVYMRWLEARFQELGGTFERRTLATLDELRGAAPVVVNCSGVWARDLAKDPTVEPLRGQVVRLQNPGLARGIIDELTPRALAHTIPRSGDVVAGGTLEKGNWSLEPDAATERRILEKARLLEPSLAGARILGRAVGLRPWRPEIRLEVERREGFTAIHNYGHAGAGVSLSWGCADEVCALAQGERGGPVQTGAASKRKNC